MFRQVMSSRLALLPLLGLTTFFPFLRLSSPFFAFGDGARELVCLLELAFLVCALFDRKLRLPDPLDFPKAIRWALGVWIAWSIGATLLSDHGARALVRQSEWFIHALTAGVLWAWLRAHPIHVRLIGAAIPIGFLLVSGVVAARLPWGESPRDGTEATILGFENIRHYGYYAVIALAYLAARPAALPLSVRSAALPFAAMTAAWTLLVWSGSRGATAAVAATAALLWISRIDPAWKKCVALVAAALVLGSGLSLLLPRVAPSHGFDRILRHSGIRGEIPKNITTFNFITNGRTVLWSKVAPQTLDHPWFGHGPDGYLYSGAMGTRSEQPHNVFLQFVFEWGMVGAVAMLALLFLVLRQQVWHVRALRRRSEPDDDRVARLGALAALMALCIQSLVDGTLHNAFPLALGAISLAICAQPAPGTPLPPLEGGRRPAYAAAVAVLAGVFILHTWVMVALSDRELPEPGATRTQVVRGFPSRVEAVGDGWSVFYWAADWAKTDPQRAIDWLHFGHHHARQPWRFYQFEGRLLLARGDRQAARWHFEKALAHGYSDEHRAASAALLDRLDRAPSD